MIWDRVRVTVRVIVAVRVSVVSYCQGKFMV